MNQSARSILLLIFAAFALPSTGAADWWCFRGTGGNSVADLTGLPVELSDTTNLAWKVELPGRGPSGPIVVGDKVLVTCSGGPKEDQLYVVCFDSKSGDKIWQRRFRATGRCFCHPLSANAAPTPCSDGQFVYAFYSSNDLFCLDLDGNLKWCRALAVDHPRAGHDTGMSSSPAVYGDVVVCQVENQGDSFATGIDRHTGKTLWEIPRDKEASWSSPLIFQPSAAGGRAVCLLQSGTRATIVDLQTGQQVWEKEGRGNPIPSATAVRDRLYIPIDGLTVVGFDDGEFREVFNSSRLAAGSQSSIVHNGRIYTFGRSGVMKCSDPESGETVWQLRVGGQHWTTPLVADNHMYFFDQAGKVSVVKLDGEFGDHSDRMVHQHEFADEVFLGSPAAADGALFMRSDRYLYKFAKDPI